jgi:ubiquinone/menaquinone biosynthesis C-methylase UbiE
MMGVRSWLRRRLSLDPAPTPARYWDDRARQFGRRAVYNVGHKPEELEAVDRLQKSVLLPILREHLTGLEEAVLDLGCGVGRFSGDLAELTRARVTAVDVSRHLLALAPERARVRYVLSSATSLPFPDGSFDLVWVCLLLGALRGESLSKAAQEIERVSKRNALLFLVENTTSKADVPSWAFRRQEDYFRLLPGFGLRDVASYDDLGETISVLVGRRS